MNRLLYQAAFGVGLIAVGWVGYGYLGSNLLALAVTALIGAFYVMGALELRRFHQATAALGRALTPLPERLPALGGWLAQLPESLQQPVRQRIEGARTGLPGPVMTPYLAGLLVLLGMLGTFLGMVVTLNGTAIALDSTTDLQAIRASLAAPVKGLGLAFGTSVAGVSASAMLGLMSALCRRERLQVAQLLDGGIAGVLRVFTPAHQRDESLRTLQEQARLMPELVDRLQAMMGRMERQGDELNQRLLAGQDGFYRHAETAYSGLAASVDRSLAKSLTEGARVAGATIQPVVEATMAAIARETASLHDGIASTVALQFDQLAGRFGGTVTTVADAWTTALAQHERSSGETTAELRAALEGFNRGFEQRAAGLLDSVGRTQGAMQAELATAVQGIVRQTATLQQQMADTAATRLDGVSAGFAQRAETLLQGVDQAHVALQARLAERDEARLAAWRESLETTAAALQQQWQQAGEQALARQEAICTTLDRTARDITAQAEAHAKDTLAEIARLTQAAAEAPKAAAEVIGQLRQKLSDSIAKDNELLQERSRMMETLATLLDAVDHAAARQRGAIDSLVESSTALLTDVGTRFSETVEAESGRMTAAAAQLGGSAAEVSSLGEAFGFGVQLFSESNDRLMASLQQIDGSLSRSASRSDEQLAYYVAQAREIIDLSIMSQKQIVDDLQQLARRQSALAGEAA